MSAAETKSAERPEPDRLLVDIASYTADYRIDSATAYETAFYCLMDSLACGFQALKFPACTQAAGPGRARRHDGGRRARARHFVRTRSGAGRVQHRLRWSAGSTSTTPGWPPSGDIRPTTSAPSWPSPTTCRAAGAEGTAAAAPCRDVLTAMIKAHEIQGVLALENSFNRVGLDHVLLVRIASTAVVTRLLGGTTRADRQCRLQRLDRRRRAAHLPPRAQHRLAQELGRRRRHQPRRASRPHGAQRRDGLSVGALTAPNWGFYDVLFKGQPFTLARSRSAAT